MSDLNISGCDIAAWEHGDTELMPPRLQLHVALTHARMGLADLARLEGDRIDPDERADACLFVDRAISRAQRYRGPSRNRLVAALDQVKHGLCSGQSATEMLGALDRAVPEIAAGFGAFA